MNLKNLVASGVFLVACMVLAQEKTYPKAKVSFDDFKHLVGEVEPHRAQRLINFDTFLKMSQDPETIILDTRSTFRYEGI